ncbi:caspase family protein [Neolewinella agarilytica]|uniref:caspase family protein n=1 Tax=Neolewinella agarilytica TaxID=478744 RepID=UPI002352FA34|nr:caspase family protein [Neolewinella agarilytica]
MKQAVTNKSRPSGFFSLGGKKGVWLPLLFLYLMIQPMVTQAQIRAIRPFSGAKALIVGVSEYRDDKITDLEYADDDAEAFANLLTHQTAWKLDAQDIVLLTNEEATYGKFLAELDRLIEEAQPKERIILYFAGHGDVEVVSENKMGYLLFHDASATTYATGGACMVNTLDDALSRLILEKKAEVILITDACRSGTLAGSQNGGPAATAAVISQLFGNTVKILSCEPDQSSLEDDSLDGGRGIFSYYLIKGLSGAADENEDRYVNLLELERYLVDEVMAASGDQQIPTTAGSKTTKLSKVDRAQAPVASPTDLAKADPVSLERDTPLIEKFVAFGEAIETKNLLYPKGASAYDLYRSMGESADAVAFKKVMKISLLSVLQEDAQQALNDYVTSPGKELGRRWANADIYNRYPEYLETAAELLGTESSFYADTKSRAHYFRGVNLRLQAERAGGSDSLYQLAMAEQDKALALQPVAPHIYNEKGIIYRHFKNGEQELLAFKTANALSPRWGLALMNLAGTYKERKEYEEAETLYRDAISLDEELALSYYNLARLFEEQRKIEEAIEMYYVTISKPSPNANAYYNLARLLLYEEGFQDASESREMIKRYVRLEPEDYYGKLLLAETELKVGSPEKADSLYSSALKDSPDNPFILYPMAVRDEAKKDYPAAIARWTKIIELRPDLSQFNLNLANMYVKNGQAEEAITALQALLEAGYDNYAEIGLHERFASLRDTPAFVALLDKYFPDR